MTPEANNNEIQDQANRFQQHLNRFTEIVETVCRETDALPQLPRKQRAREAFRLHMILAEEASIFLGELFTAAQNPHIFDLITGLSRHPSYISDCLQLHHISDR
jgi:hypothetical protein